jgi:hypothetical protein
MVLKDEAMMTDVEQIVAPQVPPSMIQISESLGNEISQISGVNEELLGSAIDDKAGVLSMLRQGAGLTTLQGLFDQLDRSQKLLGKIMIDLIQANFTPGKIKKIIEAEPTPQFYNKAFGKYDAVIEEGMNTSTQKQMQFAQLMQLKEIGVPVPDEAIIEAATLQEKKKLVESINQAKQQQMQMQQTQMQVQMAEIQARTELSKARAIADEGLGMERASRVQENQALAVERRAQAMHDQDSALLEKVRALKELESLDIEHIERLMTLANMLKQQDTNMQAGGQQAAK